MIEMKLQFVSVKWMLPIYESVECLILTENDHSPLAILSGAP